MLLMRKYDEENSACLLSHPVRGAWIEIFSTFSEVKNITSHPVRGAWIEIYIELISDNKIVVAPRQGCVD